MQKKRIAVFLGGRAPEHDVSIVSGLQAVNALDSSQYDPFVVYVATDGRLFVGEELHKRENYLPDASLRNRLSDVTLDVSHVGKGRLIPKSSKLFSRAQPIEFDAALLAFHGSFGEDGSIQGMLEFANIPYTGARVMASSVFMDKDSTKRLLSHTDIPFLPHRLFTRPQQGRVIPDADIKKTLEGLSFPLCIKPVHLGSSIGVSKATNLEDIFTILPQLFKYDYEIIAEPYIENLVEYNVAVMRKEGKVITSAIERPKRHDDLLDFKQKYLSGGSSKASGIKGGGVKSPGQQSEGMLSLTRDINPNMPKALQENIVGAAVTAFETLKCTGAVRIDFYANAKTEQVWMNEVNPCPGSFGYFLWEASSHNIGFTTLLNMMIEEAFELSKKLVLPEDPTLPEARLFNRRG